MKLLTELKRAFAILMIFSTVFLSGCWNSRELNTLAIAVCIGIDKSDNGYIITNQVINPKAIASKKTINQSPVVLYSEEDKDIFEAYRKMTSECPRKIYNSHLRMVVISEEAAREGINKFLDFFARDHEFRTDFYFTIARGTTAQNVLSMLTPLEAIPGIEMYNSLKTSELAWAPTKSVKIVELVNSILADGKSAVLTGIEVTPGDNDSNSITGLSKTNSLKKLKYTSLGAFKKDMLTGWLNEEQSKGFNYITGNVSNTVGYLQINENVKITFEATKVKSKINVHMLDGKPAIEVEINIDQNVGAVSGEFDVSKPENKNKLDELSGKKIKGICEDSVNKAKNELKTDIFGFGEAIHRKYPKVWEKLKDNWENEFPELPVKITVKAETKQLGQITKPFFIKE